MRSKLTIYGKKIVGYIDWKNQLKKIFLTKNPSYITIPFISFCLLKTSSDAHSHKNILINKSF